MIRLFRAASHRHSVSICLLLFFLSACRISYALSGDSRNLDHSGSYVSDQLTLIASEKPSVARTQRAEELASWIDGENLKRIDLKDIEVLSSMLNGSDDSISFWFAIALGHIGPRASVAVPMLQKRLEYVTCFRTNGISPELSSAQAIRSALSKLGVVPQVIVCK